jgi:hypothetical protein
MFNLSAVKKVKDLGRRKESLLGALVLLALAANCAAAPGTPVVSGMTSTSPGGFVYTGISTWVTDASAGFCQITAGDGGVSTLQYCVTPPTTNKATPILGQPAYDGVGYVYLPDRSSGSNGIWRYAFDGLGFNPASGVIVAPKSGFGGQKPGAVAIGSDGSLYVTMTANASIYRIDSPSTATPVATNMGSTLSKTPAHGLAFVGTQLWIADRDSMTFLTNPLTCGKGALCTPTANTQLGIASPQSIAVDAVNNLVYIGAASGVYRNNVTTSVTDLYTAYWAQNGSSGLYYGVNAVGVDGAGNLNLVDDPSLGRLVSAGTIYQVPAGSLPDGSAPQPQPAPLPTPAVVSTATSNPAWLYSSGLTTPKGALWMGNHMWVVDRALGFCKVDPTLPPPSLTACAALLAAEVPGLPAFDAAHNLLYIPDMVTAGEGIQVLAFDPLLETLGVANTVVRAVALAPIAGAGATAPTALAFGPDGQLYIAMAGTSKILKMTAPSTPTHVISVIGAMNNAAAANLAFYKSDLFDVETANVSIMRGATLCKGACTAQSLVAPLVTPTSVASDGNFIYIGDASQVWKYDLVAGTLTKLADIGLAPTFATTSFAGIGGLAIDPLGQVYAADHGPIWQISTIKPTIVSFSPAQGAATTTQNVTITGTNFSAGSVVTACPAITVSGVTFVSATQITATFAIGIGPVGSCGVSVATAVGTSFAANFTVLVTPPVLATITPAGEFRGGLGPNNVSVTLTGTDMLGAKVTAGPDIVTSITTATVTQVVTNFAIPATAALGTVNVTVTTPSGISNALAFTIAAPIPVLTSINPAQGPAASSIPVTLVGTGLIGATLNLPPGFTLSGVPVVTAGSISATLVIASTLPSGPQSITVTTPGGITTSVTFNILPVLTSIAPPQAKAGTATTITLTGTSLDSASINPGANITVTGVVATLNQITATFTTLNSAPLGAQSITVTNLGGTSNVVTFTITEPTPILTSIAPLTGARGASVPVTLTGSGLVGATLNLPAGITLSGPPVVAFGQITATFAIADNAPLGVQSITVTTPGGTSIAVTFTVFAPVPALTSITPALGSAASSVSVTLAGTGLVDATLNLPAGITLSGAPVVTASSITATLVISPTATGAATNTTASISVSTTGGISNVLSFTIVPRALLSIANTHIGNFTQAQAGAVYTVTVSNAATSSPTIGPVTVTETAPSGLTLVSMSGSGWTCAANTCTRADVLAGGTNYPAIAVTVNVSPVALSPQINAVTVSGGNAFTANTTDSTVINFLPPTLTAVAPVLGVIGTSVPVTFTGTNLTLATLQLPAGVAATGVVVTPTQITAVLNIALTAPVGMQGITIITPGGTTNAGTFTVLPLIPTLATITPATGAIGTSVAVTFTGTSLNGATFNLSADITATGVVTSAYQITATFAIAATAALGPQNISITTAGGTSNSMSFAVIPNGLVAGYWLAGLPAGSTAVPNLVAGGPALTLLNNPTIGATGIALKSALNQSGSIAGVTLPETMTVITVSDTTNNSTFMEQGANANLNDGFYFKGSGNSSFLARRGVARQVSYTLNWEGTGPVMLAGTFDGTQMVTYRNGAAFNSIVVPRTAGTVTDTVYVGSRSGSSEHDRNPAVCGHLEPHAERR